MTKVPNRVFIGGLPFNTKEEEIKDFFKSYGPISNVRIIKDKEGVSRGYGFITFERFEDAEHLTTHEFVFYKSKRINIGEAHRKVRNYQQNYVDFDRRYRFMKPRNHRNYEIYDSRVEDAATNEEQNEKICNTESDKKDKKCTEDVVVKEDNQNLNEDEVEGGSYSNDITPETQEYMGTAQDTVSTMNYSMIPNSVYSATYESNSYYQPTYDLDNYYGVNVQQPFYTPLPFPQYYYPFGLQTSSFPIYAYGMMPFVPGQLPFLPM